MNQRNNTCIGRGSEGELGRERKDRVDYNRNVCIYVDSSVCVCERERI